VENPLDNVVLGARGHDTVFIYVLSKCDKHNLSFLILHEKENLPSRFPSCAEFRVILVTIYRRKEEYYTMLSWRERQYCG